MQFPLVSKWLYYITADHLSQKNCTYYTTMTCYKEIHCSECGSVEVKKSGLTPQNKQRYQCKNESCKKNYIIDYTYNAYKKDIKEKIIFQVNPNLKSK